MIYIILAALLVVAGGLYLALRRRRTERRTAFGPTEAIALEPVTDEEGFRGLQQEWNELLDNSGTRSIFLSWEWLFYWWKHFKGSKQLHIVAARQKENGKLLGIAPFCRDTFKLFGMVTVRRLKLLGTERVGSDFMDLIIVRGWEATVVEAFYAYFKSRGDRWEIIEMDGVDAASVPLAFLQRINTDFKTVTAAATVCPYIRLPGSFNEYLTSLDPRMRYELKKKTRDTLQRYRMDIRVENGGRGIEERIAQIFRLHDDGFRIKDRDKYGSSSFRGDDIVKFHHDIIPQFLARNWLRLYYLQHQEKPVACLYAFTFKDSMFCYQSGFDSKWRKASPGTVLYGHCIKESIDMRMKEFHYLRGSEEYKTRWTKTAVRTLRFSMVNNTLKGMLYGMYMDGRKGLKTLRGTRVMYDE
jgi:CelD/BcsL family acetyltransferase involved in cellulose biosynthesis